MSHVSDLELFNDAIRSYKEDHPDVRYAGSYRRIMISVSSGEREEISITILRIHHIDPDGIHSYPALIPDILIPYGSYTIRFVLTLLYSYLNLSYRRDILLYEKKDICDVPRYTPVRVVTTSIIWYFQARKHLICDRACCTVHISYIFNNNYWGLSVTPVFSRLLTSCSH